jgi:hypothetical protein
VKPQIFTLGNTEILKLHKTAFLCSRNYPSNIVPKAYDWAIFQRETGNCVISGFHSQIEKDVFHYLLKGKQPIILALARGIPKRIDSTLKPLIDSGRILLVTPFSEKTTRIDSKTSMKRNQMMVEMADDIVVGYASPSGGLAGILSCINIKSITYLTEQ